MKAIIHNSLFMILNSVREWFDPAYEFSPYEKASRQPMTEKANYAPRLILKRRMAVN